MELCHLSSKSLVTYFLSVPKFHHRYGTAAVIQTHQLLIIGGYHQDSVGHLIPLQFCEILDVRKGDIQDALPMNVPHAEAAIVQNGDSSLVIISGVSLGNKPTPICEYYDRFYHSWRQIGTIRVPRIQPMATFISNEEILICGGKDANGAAITSVEIFNIKTGQSKMVAPLPRAVTNTVCFVSTVFQFPKPVIIASAYHSDKEQCSVYVYHEKNNRWERCDIALPNLNLLQWLRIYDDRVIIWGDDTFSDSEARVQQNIFVENYTGVRPVAMQTMKRRAFSLGQWNNDTLLVAGGSNEQGRCDSTTVWVDMLSGKYSFGPCLVSARREPMMRALPVFNDSGYLIEKCLGMTKE